MIGKSGASAPQNHPGPACGTPMQHVIVPVVNSGTWASLTSKSRMRTRHDWGCRRLTWCTSTQVQVWNHRNPSVRVGSTRAVTRRHRPLLYEVSNIARLNGWPLLAIYSGTRIQAGHRPTRPDPVAWPSASYCCLLTEAVPSSEEPYGLHGDFVLVTCPIG